MDEQQTKPRGGTAGLAALVVAVVALLGLCGWLAMRGTGRGTAVEMTTSYQAVLLSNGSAYFGHLEGLGSPYPVLKEVYYVQSVQDPQTKQVNNILVKRGKEWHAPDRMILNAALIVLVEPVNPSSRVAQLITQAKNQ